ncbi:hypothetical protein ACHWQZ_G009514 [Mnemiopsis leidyi]
MAEPEPEPKHPYVTRKNGTVHLVFSIIVIIMSIIQIILGIVISEEIVKKVTYHSNIDRDSYSLYGYDDLFHGDHIWVGFVGLTLAALGISVWHTRARANGIMLSIMLFLAGFVIYPIAAALGGGYTEDIVSLRVGSAIYTAVQALVIITWAFYTAFHACCNSKVRIRTQVNVPGGGTIAPAGVQPLMTPVNLNAYGQVVYIQQPGQPIQVGGAQPVQYVGGAQPVQYAGGAQPVQYAGGAQPVQYVGGAQPFQYVGGAPHQQPVYVMQQGPPQYVPAAQVPVQVQHGASPQQDGNPPSYAE